MRPGLFMVGRGGAIWPANGRTQEDMRALNLQYGDLITVQVVRSRNPKLCALAHVVVHKVAEGLGLPDEAVMTKLKEALGYCDLVREPDGKVKRAPRSMRFEDMRDEDDFRAFWRAAEELICTRLLPELADEEAEQVLMIMAGRGKR